MRKFLRTILRILDGSPSMHMATRNRQRGQSLLELAFITPLLAILIAGASEVGWYTNRWLSLLEVTRVGARSATFLQSGLSAPEWDDNGSIVPRIQTDVFSLASNEISVLVAENARDCDTGSNFGFYSYIACLMQDSLDPLTLNIDFVDPLDFHDAATEESETDPPSYDDMVISVFAIQNVNNANYVGLEPNNEGVADGRPVYQSMASPPQPIDHTSDMYKYTYDLNDASSVEYPPGLQNIVVGRYPVNANECNYKGANNANKVLLSATDAGYEKDPFNYLDNDSVVGAVTFSRIYGSGVNTTQYQLELSDPSGDPLSDSQPEAQRGWALTGQHRIDDDNLFCFGSEFGIRDIERLVNMPGFIQPDLYDPPSTDKLSPQYQAWLSEVYDSQNERLFFEPQGMTLVEIFWEHEMMLNFPLFRPIQETFGEGDIVIALWTAFPLPSVAPNITYQLP